MISFEHWLVIISIPISTAGAFVYIRDTLRGKTKPNRVSWLMWALAPLLSTVVAISAHADLWATARVFIAGFIPVVVLIASFYNPQGYWKLTVFDIACGVFSAIALVVWLVIGSSNGAIIFLVVGDALACLPTIRKAWQHPETETGTPFLAGLIGSLLVLPSIPVWNIQNSAFQVYLILANVALLFSIYRKRINPISNSRE